MLFHFGYNAKGDIRSKWGAGIMPVHDWKRVSAGTFHDFHCSWLPLIKDRLNNGILPADFYAQTEQRSGRVIPDLLTLRADDHPKIEPTFEGGRIATLAEAPPQVEIVTDLEINTYAEIARSLVIRHSSADEIVAIVELVSPGNKWSDRSMRRFLDKVLSALHAGIHFLIIDLFPPTPRDPQGIHGAIWSELGDDSYHAPQGKSLTMVAYTAGVVKTGYVEPIAVADVLKPMPLFLDLDHYVNVPLEETYMAAFHGVPMRYRDELTS
jgi:Protein of unknown function (DUF4058)